MLSRFSSRFSSWAANLLRSIGDIFFINKKTGPLKRNARKCQTIACQLARGFTFILYFKRHKEGSHFAMRIVLLAPDERHVGLS